MRPYLSHNITCYSGKQGSGVHEGSVGSRLRHTPQDQCLERLVPPSIASRPPAPHLQQTFHFILNGYLYFIVASSGVCQRCSAVLLRLVLVANGDVEGAEEVVRTRHHLV